MVTAQQLPTLVKIKDVLKKGECYISSLQEQTGIKRSTLNYYLRILENEGIIVRKRINEKVTGRPTLISLNFDKFKERKKKLEKEILEHLKHPIIKEIIKNIKKGIKEEKILKSSIINYSTSQINDTLNFLVKNEYLERRFFIAKEGEEYLKNG